MTSLLLVFVLTLQTPAPVAARAAESAKLSKSEAQADLGSIKGRIRQLAWSPDGKELYLQTFEVNRDNTPKEFFHYSIVLPGGAVKILSAPPAWAAAYITWKSDKAAPGDPALAIELETARKRMDTTGAPMAGGMATGSSDGNASGTSIESAISAANQSQMVNVYTMRFKGEVVGEWINSPIIPGQTFGWGPTGSGLIAFADAPNGRVIIMDGQGGKTRVPDTKGAIVPAWSQDGTRLAWLENRGKNKYVLVVANVTW